MIELIMAMSRNNFKLRIAQINLMRSNKALCDLNDLQNRLRFDIALVSEPPLCLGMMITNSRIRIIQARGTEQNPVKAAILVYNRSIMFSNHDVIARTEAVELKLCSLNQQMNIVSIYLSPSSNSLEAFNLIKNCQNEHIQVIIGGDFNARNTKWYNKITTHRGKIVEEACDEANFIILNDNIKPTFEAYRCGKYYGSSIDLTMVNKKAYEILTNWKVEDNYIIRSDHNLITFDIGLSKAYRNKGTILYDTRSVDWNNFKKTFMRELKQIKNVKKNRGERKEL